MLHVMRRTLLAVLLLIPLRLSAQPDTSWPGFIRYPDVGATQIVFVYDNQIWVVPKQGGTAVRLSETSEAKSHARLSPDEKTIAFTGGAHYGIYTIPVTGGNVHRITHHPGTTTLCDWTPDGQVLFMTDGFGFVFDNDDQARFRQLFTVPARGGLPHKLEVPYGAHGSISADGQWLAYTLNANGITEARKHYFGGFAPDIWIFGLHNHQAKAITDWKGTDTFPMWHGQTVYYLSDEGSEGRLNIWSYDLESARREQLTHFKDFDVKWPSIGPEHDSQGEIVFVNGLDLYLLDLGTKQSRKVQVTIPDRFQEKLTVDASKLIVSSRLNPDGSKALIEARGDIWVVDSSSGDASNITRTSGSAERDPAWSPDGAWVTYFSDVTGEYELYISRPDGSERRQLTRFGAGFRFRPMWAPDSQRIALHDNTGCIYVHTLETGETRKIDRDPLVQRPQMSWSPDSKWLAYARAASNNRYTAIWLHSIDEARSHQVTSGFHNDSWPIFDRTGDYLYFVSARNFSAITFDSIDYNNFIYPASDFLFAVPLPTGLGPPWSSKVNSVGAASQIDLDDFERRAVVVLRDKGHYSNLAAGDHGQILFTFTPPDGAPSVKQLDLAKARDAQTIVEGVDGFAISQNGRKILVTNESGLFIIGAAPQQKLDKPLQLDRMKTEIDLRAEGQQIFAEAWRLYRDFFYDESLRGVDWPAMRAKYGKLAALCNRREDIYEVIREMLGELGSSHLSVSPTGNEYRTPEDTGMMAVDFELSQGAYRIAKIHDGAAFDPRARNPLYEPGVNVREGNYLLAVNGVRIDTSQDPWLAFKDLAGATATLTISEKPLIDQTAREVTVKLHDYLSESVIRQRTWVEANRQYVDKQSAGQVGYMYVADTFVYGPREFSRQLSGQMDKKALIIDSRWNEGGHWPLHFIEVLARQPYLYEYFFRRDNAEKVPSYLHEGPKCLLINGVQVSGGDALPYFFRKRGLGKLIGTTTMGGFVGVGGIKIPFIDGGSSKIPVAGSLDASGSWIVEGTGVPPDITVVDDPSLMWRGGDPQLDRAIQQMLSEIKETRTVPPPGPRK